jgi:hypothetical protein
MYSLIANSTTCPDAQWWEHVTPFPLARPIPGQTTWWGGPTGRQTLSPSLTAAWEVAEPRRCKRQISVSGGGGAHRVRISRGCRHNCGWQAAPEGRSNHGQTRGTLPAGSCMSRRALGWPFPYPIHPGPHRQALGGKPFPQNRIQIQIRP